MINQNYDVNKTRYTHRDYESIKNDLIEAIPSLTQEWTTREESDPGIVLIKLMSMFGDTLSYNVDKIALELYIQTVTQRKNCAKILRLLGYKMHWYRSAKVVAHVRLVANQDVYANVNHVVLTPYKTQFTAGQVKYTVVSQNHSTDQIDIFSDQETTAIYLVQGTPTVERFNKSGLVKNRYYLGTAAVDESEILLEVTDAIRSTVTCTLADSLYLVSSSRQIYYEFNVDEYDRPYIELAGNWADVAGTDACTFTVTLLSSVGSQGNISANAFTSATSLEYSSGVNFNNLVINNLDNTRDVDDNGNIDSYNTRGYDPQTVEDARKDSSNYVFTHDTLVTSSDFEKGCKRVDGITVSKLVDSQVVINDSLNLNEICTRAEDQFDKVFVEEYDETEPDVVSVNEYLLQYLIIMYLVYQNFNPETNDYVQSLGASSLYSLADYKYDDPYNSKYWEPTIERVSTGSPDDVYELEGPVSDPDKGISVDVEVHVNRRSYQNFEYSNGIIKIQDLLKPILDSSQIESIIVYSGDTRIKITHYTYSNLGNNTFSITITDNIPDEITSVIINGESISSGKYTYDSNSDTLRFSQEYTPLAESIVEITKRYRKTTYKITLKDAPSQVSSLIVSGEVINNYDYKDGVISLRKEISNPEYLVVNNQYVSKSNFTFSRDELTAMKSPGYYPYKMTSPYLNNIRQYLDTLQVLNVQVEFGTVKVFPFKVVGTLHLTDSYSPQEVLQIVKTVDDALDQAYYPDLHNIGERPDFLELVDIIQKSDERIKYFDAVGNIVEWAPEVQARLDDFEEIFDTTSAVMYNGLSDKFILAKRYLRFKFRNYATTPDSDEEIISQISGSEPSTGSYDLPDDYGTAYLINYCAVSNQSPVIKVNPNSYYTIDISNLKELEALCEDLSFRGLTLMTYIRKLTTSATVEETANPSWEVSERFTKTTYDNGAVDGYNTEFISNSLDIDSNGNIVGEYRVKYSDNSDQEKLELKSEVVNGSCKITATLLTHLNVGDDPLAVTPNSSVVECFVGDEEYIGTDKVIKVVTVIDKSKYTYYRNTGQIVFDESIKEDENIRSKIYIRTALADRQTLTIERRFYQYTYSSDSSQLLDYIKINNSNFKYYSVGFGDEEYKVFEQSSLFDSPDSSIIGNLNEQSANLQILDLINDNSDEGVSLLVKLYKTNTAAEETPRVVSQYTNYQDTPYVQGSSSADESKGESYVEKMVLINNTGLRWIEGN